jgi:cysteine-rich repeat protein
MSKSASGSDRRTRTFAVTSALAIAIAAAAWVVAAAPAHAATVQFAATIDAAQETPPNGSTATGSGTMVMDTDANTLTINVTFSGLGSPELFSHIHGFSGPGVPAGIVFGLPNGSPKNAVWNFMEAQQAQIIAGLTYVNIHSNGFPGGEIRGQVLRTPSCGDEIVDGGEQCDDGNNDNGDCCDSACQFESNSTPCGDGLCNAGTCDGAGSCDGGGEIRANCRDALKSLLLIKNSQTDDNKDKLIFKWIKGAATTVEEFGLPTGTTSYALCLYAGTAAIASATVPPSATLWAPAGTTGFKYKDPARAQDGIQKIILKAGAAGKSKALVKGKGANLPQPPAGPLALPVTAQLVNDANAVCFEGVFDTADVIKNETEQFKAKAQ